MEAKGVKARFRPLGARRSYKPEESGERQDLVS